MGLKVIQGLCVQVALVVAQPADWGYCDPESCLDLQILYTSMLQGSYIPVTSSGAPCDPEASSACSGGTARRVAYVEKARRDNARNNRSTLFVDLGGSTFGGPFNGHPDYPFGTPETILHNMTPYDVCVFGTRDFMSDESDVHRAQMADSYAQRSCPTVLSNAKLKGPWENFGKRTKPYVIQTLSNGWKVAILGMMAFAPFFGYTYGAGVVDLDPNSLLNDIFATVNRGAADKLQVNPFVLQTELDTTRADPQQMDPYPGDVMLLSTIMSVDTLKAAEAVRLADPDVKALILLMGDNKRDDQIIFMAEKGPFDIIMRESWPTLGATPSFIRSKVYNKTVLVAGSATPLGLGSLRARITLGHGVERYAFTSVPLNASFPNDAKVQATMSALYSTIRQRDSLPYGHITNPLTGGHRGGEAPPTAYQCYWTDCPAGNTLGRALLWKARAAGYKADLSLSNLGSLRAPLYGANKTISISHCKSTNAFQNSLGLYTVLGKNLYASVKAMFLQNSPPDRGFIGAGLRVAFHEPCFQYFDHRNYTLLPNVTISARCANELALKDTAIKMIDAQVQMMDWDSCSDLARCQSFEWRRLEKGTLYTVVITDFYAAQLIGFQPLQVGLGADAQALCDFIAANDPVEVEPWVAFRDRGAVQYDSPEEGWAAGNRVPSVKVDVSVLDDAPTCPDGMFLPARARACQPCPAGSHSTADSARDRCDLCAVGFFGNATGMKTCTVCPAGFHTDVAASTACEACVPGRVSDPGAFYCNECKEGTYSGAFASDRCLLCELGRFLDTTRGSACIGCRGDLVTVYPGAAAPSLCICPEGRFLPWDEEENCSTAAALCNGSAPSCLPCPAGMSCAAGSDMRAYFGSGQLGGTPTAAEPVYPRLLPGYWSAASAPLDVYQCSNSKVCPGGAPGTCANEHTVGTSCASCPDKYYVTPTGCKPCRNVDIAPAIAVALLAVVLAALLLALTAADAGSARFALVTVALTAGQLVCTVQMLGVMRNFHIMWEEPLSSVLQVASLIAFDLDVLKVQCIMGKDSPTGVCVIRLLALPCVATILLLFMLAVGRCKARASFDCDRYLNALGLLFVMLYVSITVAMVSPLRCTLHPNGRRSMSAKMSIMCWESKEHAALVAMSITGFLCYPIFMLSRVALATWRYPVIVAAGRGSQLVNRYRFLFARFRPERYYWGFWYLLRNLLLPLVPVVASTGLVQVFLAGLLLHASCCLQAMWSPWRTRLANVSELASLVGILLFIETASVLSAPTQIDAHSTISNLVLAVLLITLAIAVGTVLCGAVQYMVPGKKYDLFLSHHKEGAGSLARWFKMQATSYTWQLSVFLDSDELDSIDAIVDIVRSLTKNLVVLLSKLTLTRIWCAAEITAARVAGLNFVLVTCSDYTPPDELFICTLDQLWTKSQQQVLIQNGVPMENIKYAYEYLSTLPSIELNRFSPQTEHLEVVRSVLNACAKGSIMAAGSRPSLLAATGSIAAGDYLPDISSQQVCSTLLLGAPTDAESRSTCEVLRMLVERKTGKTATVLYTAQEAQVLWSKAEFLLIVLTRGMIYDVTFAEVGVIYMESQSGQSTSIDIVVALADNNFPFPAPDFYKSVAPPVAAFMRKVFNILALPFSPHAGIRILEVQVDQLCKRFVRQGRLSGTLPAIEAAPVGQEHIHMEVMN